MRAFIRLSMGFFAMALALTMSVPANAAIGVRAGAGAASTVSSVTAVAPSTVYISVANRYLTMPHLIHAGISYVQVRTTDTSSKVQVVRPPAGYTPRQFLDAATLWRSKYQSGADPRAAYNAFVHSVTFVGGAAATPGAAGAFAQNFTAGTYWLYESSYEGPTHLARIVVLTVVGTAPAQIPVPLAGIVRFTAAGGVTLPSHLPTAGWLKPIGGAPLNGLLVYKLKPGVTQADLDTRGVCFGTVPSKSCFETGSRPQLGGYVSAGASAYWYYRLPAGEYVTGNIAPTDGYYTRPFLAGNYARFAVS